MIKSLISIAAVIGAVSLTAGTHAVPPPSHATEYSFVCPEALPTDQARVNALGDFVQWFRARHPDTTVGGMLAARYALLESHHCKQTLTNIRKGA
jgi:hypothetical protein